MSDQKLKALAYGIVLIAVSICALIAAIGRAKYGGPKMPTTTPAAYIDIAKLKPMDKK